MMEYTVTGWRTPGLRAEASVVTGVMSKAASFRPLPRPGDFTRLAAAGRTAGYPPIRWLRWLARSALSGDGLRRPYEGRYRFQAELLGLEPARFDLPRITLVGYDLWRHRQLAGSVWRAVRGGETTTPPGCCCPSLNSDPGGAGGSVLITAGFAVAAAMARPRRWPHGQHRLRPAAALPTRRRHIGSPAARRAPAPRAAAGHGPRPVAGRRGQSDWAVYATREGDG